MSYRAAGYDQAFISRLLGDSTAPNHNTVHSPFSWLCGVSVSFFLPGKSHGTEIILEQCSGEMAQSEKCWPRKREDVSPTLQNLCEKAPCGGTCLNPGAGKVETGRPLGLTGQLCELQLLRETPSQKVRWRESNWERCPNVGLHLRTPFH